MSAAEIAEDLYSVIPDKTIAAAAKDEVMILTGEAATADYYGYIQIGQYEGARVFDHCEIWALLGTASFSAVKTDDGYRMLMPYSEHPTAGTAEQNKRTLDNLYNVVWDIRQATEGLGQVETSDYIIGYLRFHLTNYDGDASDHIATWLEAGFADCGIYSGLYYLIGSNCGLQIDVINGSIHGESHAWNRIKLNGEWKYVDIAYQRCYYSALEAEYYGYLIK